MGWGPLDPRASGSPLDPRFQYPSGTTAAVSILGSRIKFNDTAAAYGAYEVPLNPSYLNLNYNRNSTKTSSLTNTTSESRFFENRAVKLRWERIPQDYAGFQGMIGTLIGWIDQIKYVNFEIAEYRFAGTGWNQFLITDVNVSIDNGPLIYYNVEVTLHPED